MMGCMDTQLMGATRHGKNGCAFFHLVHPITLYRLTAGFHVHNIQLAGTIIQIYPQWQINRTCVFLYLSFQQGEVGFWMRWCKNCCCRWWYPTCHVLAMIIRPLVSMSSRWTIIGPRPWAQPLCLSCHWIEISLPGTDNSPFGLWMMARCSSSLTSTISFAFCFFRCHV